VLLNNLGMCIIYLIIVGQDPPHPRVPYELLLARAVHMPWRTSYKGRVGPPCTPGAPTSCSTTPCKGNAQHPEGLVTREGCWLMGLILGSVWILGGVLIQGGGY